ncbi:MAG: YitT family protein [Bacillota bacterium]|nr:YitT family protein [Bacillota bacterium]
MLKSLKAKNCIFALTGSAILAFGLYNIHSFSGVTEGGVLGLTLLFSNWFGISPAVSGLILNALCYFIGYKVLGKEFIVYSAVSAIGFSAFYALFELFPPLCPRIADYPLAAAIVGALFVGLGVGIAVKADAAPTGDDALAMALSHRFKVQIQRVYLISDLAVLTLSLTYIPLSRIMYSLLTVVISGQLIGLIQKIKIRI